MEEASMDGSDQEPEYAYQLEDHHPHGPYEGVPEEDDDDDMDDHDDHHIDLTAPAAAVLPNLINELRVFRPEARREMNAFHVFGNYDPQVFNLPRYNLISESIFSDLLRESVGHIHDDATLRHIEIRNMEPLVIHTRRHSHTTREPSALHPLLYRPHIPVSEPDAIAAISRTNFNLGIDRPTQQRPQTSSTALDSLASLQELANHVTGSTQTQSTALRQYSPRPLAALEQADLMRAVSASRQNESPAYQIIPHRGRPFDRASHRERAEKVPSALARRWNYEPYCTGGDTLPAMFDPGLPHRRSSSAANAPHIPVIANQTHESVERLAEKVTNRLGRLLNDFYKIEHDVETLEKNIASKKKEAKKKKAEQEAKAVKEQNSTPYSAIAVRQAAAAGISLEAPANVSPAVVAAATESTGIDPAFLAALPDDMRTEILTQYFEQIRTQPPSGDGAQPPSQAAPPTSVNQDFLTALPPALRAEVLEIDAEFQSRQGGGANNAGGSGSGPDGTSNGPVAAADIDNATFLATLAPELREEILLDSNEAVLRFLPPSAAAEARMLRERDASRLPWRVNRHDLPNFPFEGRRMRDMHFSSRGERNRQREAAVFRWKKVGSGWLREVPKTEDEPGASLRSDGLSSLVSLLWLKQGQFGKSMLYQVVAHACKATESRVLVLDQLIKLITSSASQDDAPGPSSQVRIDIDRIRQHGTAVRRGLELLTMLCKSDSVIAETLLGLPKTDEEVKMYGTVSLTDNAEVEESPSNMISLSTLAALFLNPLFVRSNSHLEQLVGLFNTVCQAIPPSNLNAPQPKNSRSLSRLLDRNGVPPSMRDPMNFFVVDGDDDAPAMFSMPDDDVIVDEEESDEYFLDVLRSGRRTSEPPPPAESAGGEEKKVKKPKEYVPAQFRIPILKKTELVALSRVLLRSGCGERTYDKASKTIGLLGELQSNRNTLMSSLGNMAADAGREIQVEYQSCVVSLTTTPIVKQKKKRAELINTFSIASASNELPLLRVVKSMSTLLNHEHAELRRRGEKALGKKESVVERLIHFVDNPYQTSMVRGLQELWNALDKLLELVSDEAKLKDKKGESQEGQSSVPSAADVLNADRRRGASRNLSPVLARLSPMIEAFLVTHSSEEAKDAMDKLIATGKPPPSPRSPSLSPMQRSKKMPETFATAKTLDSQLALFVERHRGPINNLLRANPSLLESSFKGALRHPHAIDFDNKKAYFRSVIRRRSSEAHAGTIRIKVRRDRVFDDSYHQLRNKKPDQMKGRLHVQFNGEEGVDAGGVTREWYVILARQIFDPNYVLFTRSAAKAATYQPDKRSYINSEHLENFRFVGRIIGKAIYDGQLVDAYFTRSFYKHILGLKPKYHDIEAEDPEYYKSLKWMLENDCTGIIDYTMSAEYDEFGKQTIIDLVANGRNVAVTEENKEDYVRLVTDVRMSKTIEKQIEAFKEGFYELIPYEDCKIFNELELELLMSGLPDIDMADLKANVEYTGYTASSPQMNWFWRCVGKMDQEDLARLVMFVTGTSKVPLEGFSQLQGMNGGQKFQIHRVGGDTMRLPSAHTCFNQLDLPEYSTAEILSERVLRAIRECSVGFGFA